MSLDRERAHVLMELIRDVREFKLNFNDYLDDTGYRELLDSVLEGKIKTLSYYLNYLGLEGLKKTLDGLEVESGQAVRTIEILRGFVINEIELELRHLGF